MCVVVTPLNSSLMSQVAPVFVLMFTVFLVVLLLACIVGRKEEKKKTKDNACIKAKNFPDILSRPLTMSH